MHLYKMFKPLKRMTVLCRHLHTITAPHPHGSVPHLSIHPTTTLMDETVKINVTGLCPGQLVTLTSYLEEGGSKFEARGVYKASSDGTVDNFESSSLDGTFTDKEPMGLFWSLKPIPGQKPGLRLVKKDVTTPLDITISVYDGAHSGDSQIQQSPLTSATVHRRYMCPTVKRVPVTGGPFLGTIFIPEGEGPFPGIIDTYGGLVSLIETRAALLASRGYATFALSYLYQGHLPNQLMSADPNYFRATIEWFSQQDYVDADNLGAVGLCYGGCLSLVCAAMTPKLRAVVNINGLPVVPSYLADPHEWKKSNKIGKCGTPWPNPDLVYTTEEGVVINEAFDCDDLMCIPAWQHGAKVLVIVGEDDKQVHLKYHRHYFASWPEPYRANLEYVTYPGAGHLMEPPYSPLCRVVYPGRKRMATIGFVKEELGDELMMCGGFPKEHAVAQLDAWTRVLDFLNKNLKDT